MVDRAAEWERSYQERKPKRQPPQPNVDQIRNQIRSEFNGQLKILAEECGRITGSLEKAAREAREAAGLANAQLLVRVLALHERLDALEARLADEPEPAPRLRAVG